MGGVRDMRRIGGAVYKFKKDCDPSALITRGSRDEWVEFVTRKNIRENLPQECIACKCLEVKTDWHSDIARDMYVLYGRASCKAFENMPEGNTATCLDNFVGVADSDGRLSPVRTTELRERDYSPLLKMWPDDMRKELMYEDVGKRIAESISKEMEGITGSILGIPGMSANTASTSPTAETLTASKLDEMRKTIDGLMASMPSGAKTRQIAGGLTPSWPIKDWDTSAFPIKSKDTPDTVGGDW